MCPQNDKLANAVVPQRNAARQANQTLLMKTTRASSSTNQRADAIPTDASRTRRNSTSSTSSSDLSTPPPKTKRRDTKTYAGRRQRTQSHNESSGPRPSGSRRPTAVAVEIPSLRQSRSYADLNQCGPNNAPSSPTKRKRKEVTEADEDLPAKSRKVAGRDIRVLTIHIQMIPRI